MEKKRAQKRRMEGKEEYNYVDSGGKRIMGELKNGEKKGPG
jgi:hypothetical protein